MGSLISFGSVYSRDSVGSVELLDSGGSAGSLELEDFDITKRGNKGNEMKEIKKATYLTDPV